ncbi:YjbQ family protein [Candidatus Kaiserbacteria bacterium]|nr:YjbQ family protein [Candidatus Kaiserbacteria bacterium]
MAGTLNIQTNKKREVVDITDDVQRVVGKSKGDGACHLFVLHTTAALSIADLDVGGTDQDYLDAFEKIVPRLNYRHPHDPSHMPDHILSTLIGTSLTVPVRDGSLVLGTWQRVVLFEFDGPRERQIVVQLLASK